MAYFTMVDFGGAGIHASDINDKGQIVGQYVDTRGVATGGSWIYSNGIANPFTTDVNSVATISLAAFGGVFPQNTPFTVQGINNEGYIFGQTSSLVTVVAGPNEAESFNSLYIIAGITSGNATRRVVGFASPAGPSQRGELLTAAGTGGSPRPGDPVPPPPPFHIGSNPTAITFADPNGQWLSVGGMNDAGTLIVGGYDAGGHEHGFIYTVATNTFSDLNLGVDTFIYSVNNSGTLVGSFTDASGVHGFVDAAGVISVINNPNGTSTVVTGINNAGVIVGNYSAGGGTHSFIGTPGNDPPPAGTTANMVLRRANGTYETYNIGHNAILNGAQLGQVGADFQFVGLGNFNASDTTDMMLRSSTTGAFQVYDIVNNNLTGSASLGAVGLDWQVMGFGNFGSFGENDMILRNAKSGGVEVYNLRNNQITGAAFMGTVGLNWQVAGFGNFSSRGTSDMILRNKDTGGLEVYDINSNQITGAAFMGTVGLDWQVLGFGNFSSRGTSDMIMRNTKTGGLEVYDINSNQITGAAFLGTVGLDWQFAGVAPVHAAGATDLVLRNINTGAFEVYDIDHNQITGAALLGTVGLDWQLGGFAANSPAGSPGVSSSQAGIDPTTWQLVQAMAGFGGSGAGESLNAAPLNADTLQQPLLTTPQHT